MPQDAALPLFFRRVVGVDPKLHAGLRLDRGAGFGFAAGAQSVPLGLGEIEAASRHYPVLFTDGDHPVPMALLGLDAGGNLFVGPDGRWTAGCYVPATIRAFPFIFVEDRDAGRTYVGIEPDAACLGEDRGERLFEDGAPTPALNDAVALCAAWRDSLSAAAAFAAALQAAGVLAAEEATVSFSRGGATRVHGFKMVKPEQLDAVPDATFLEWRRRGWIGALYAQMQSSANWGRLIDLAAARHGDDARPPPG